MAALQGHPAQTRGNIVASAYFFKSKANDKNLLGLLLDSQRMHDTHAERERGQETGRRWRNDA